MTRMVEVPLWLLILILGFAAVAALTHVFGPAVRWFFRRRMERLVDRLNLRLDRKIEPWKLMRRQDMIVRLVHDPKVMEAVVEHAAETGTPESVVFAEAKSYAREIVPAFSATVYFGFAIRAARWLSEVLYRVKIGKVDRALLRVDPQATVIFVMNHRSNMDYVLVTWLVADRLAISYAVGEWAQVWPLSSLIRSMGAYFIRRNSRNALYRRVLARYVQMATAEGTTQAIFPEGGLSLDGQVGSARMGLLSYVVAGFDPAGRDVVFVPVGLAYDRVLEDRLLVEAGATGRRQFRANPMGIAGFILRISGQKIRGRFPGFGVAAAAFGPPLSLRGFLATAGADPIEALGLRLMEEIGKAVPMLPVPLAAAVVAAGATDRAGLLQRMEALTGRLSGRGAVLRLPQGGADEVLAEGLRQLLARGIVEEAEGQFRTAAGREALLQFYAASALQRAGVSEV